MLAICILFGIFFVRIVKALKKNIDYLTITSLSIGKDTCIVAIKSILQDILTKAPENIILTWKRKTQRIWMF